MRMYLNKEIKELNTSYPGFIYNFNPEDQTADVQLAIETLYVGLDAGYTTEKKARLNKVPIQFQRGAGWALTFPIPDGTPCYIHFAQRGIDHWLMEGKEAAGLDENGVPAAEFRRYYSHNSAVAIVGINPLTNPVSNFATDSAELRNANHDQVISLKSDGSVNIITGSTIITLGKSGDITIHSNTKIILDSDVHVTKTLTVDQVTNANGGIAAKGGSDSTVSINGKMEITSTINGIQVESHVHPYIWTDGSGNSNTSPPDPS